MILTIISGGSRGIGKAIAENLKDLGHELYPLHSGILDLEDFNNTYSHLLFVRGECPHNQINLILCAAQIGTFENLDLEEILKLFKINVLGNLAIIKAVAQAKPSKLRVVWFAGGGAAFAYPDFFGYSLTKVAVVRAVENLSIMLKKTIDDLSIIALAPGAVETDMLKTVIAAGSEIRTRTDISEPVNFVRRFITDQLDSKALNGKFLHVRDNIDIITKDIFQLRRIQ